MSTSATAGADSPAPPEPPLDPVRRRRTGRSGWSPTKGDLPAALMFIAPALLGLAVFFLLPMLRGVYLSFTEYNILGTPTFVGTANYEAIARDPLFWNALGVTGQYVVINIVLQTLLALGIALLMQRIAKSTFIRGMLLLPYLMANVIAALLWFWLLDYQIGIVNHLLETFGGSRVAFFGSEEWAIPTQALINTWRHMGYTALLIFAGLQVIPKQLYEAASLDGSNAVQTFFRITLPLLRPVLVLVLVVTVIGSFQVFDTVAVTTQGGPVNASRVMQYYIFQKAFTESQFGYGSALAVILFLILVLVAFVQMKFLRGNESDLG